MSTRDLLIREAQTLPEPVLNEVWHYLTFLKQQNEKPQSDEITERKFGCLPGPVIFSDDFDEPLECFAHLRP